MSEQKLIPILFIANSKPCRLLVKAIPLLEKSQIHSYLYNYMICLLRQDDSYGSPLNYRCSYSIENDESAEVVSSHSQTFTPDDKRDIIKFIHAPQKLFENTGYKVLRFSEEPQSQQVIEEQVKLWNSSKKT